MKHFAIALGFIFATVLLAVLALKVITSSQDSPAPAEPQVAEERNDSLYPQCPFGDQGLLLVERGDADAVCVFSAQGGEATETLRLTTERLTIERDNDVLVSLTCEGGDDGKDSVDCFGSSQPISFFDVTGDGALDIKVRNWCGAYQCGYTYYLYSTQSGKYIQSELLSGLTEPYYDSETKTIVEYAKGRGLGDMFVTTEYALLADGAYEIKKRCVQDMVDFDNPETDYVYYCEERQNGVMATTTYKVIPSSEVWE